MSNATPAQTLEVVAVEIRSGKVIRTVPGIADGATAGLIRAELEKVYTVDKYDVCIQDTPSPLGGWAC